MAESQFQESAPLIDVGADQVATSRGCCAELVNSIQHKWQCYATLTENHQQMIALTYFKDRVRSIVTHPGELAITRFKMEMEQEWNNTNSALREYLDLVKRTALSDGAKERHIQAIQTIGSQDIQDQLDQLKREFQVLPEDSFMRKVVEHCDKIMQNVTGPSNDDLFKLHSSMHECDKNFGGAQSFGGLEQKNALDRFKAMPKLVEFYLQVNMFLKSEKSIAEGIMSKVLLELMKIEARLAADILEGTGFRNNVMAFSWSIFLGIGTLAVTYVKDQFMPQEG